MRDDGNAKLVIAKEIHERFYAMKTYGKEPESLGSITRLMLNDLADFSPEKVMAAFQTHAQRSAEFPTTHDLISIIRRNGKPPLRESDVIAVRKKAGEDRTPDEWALLREWDAEQNAGWSYDVEKAQSDAIELSRLRQEVTSLKAENARLSRLLVEKRQAAGLLKPMLSTQEKVKNTVRAMREGGAPEADVEDFVSGFGMSMADVA